MPGWSGCPTPASPPSSSAVSAARPKIADYPFTTLHPQLGVVRLNATEEFVLADIPGLIEGAHEGAGLGDRFLGHVERCAVLLHLVDGTQPDPAGAWRTVRAELAGYGGGLAEKPELVALNKADAMTPQARASRRKALERAVGASGAPDLRRDRGGGAGGPQGARPRSCGTADGGGGARDGLTAGGGRRR